MTNALPTAHPANLGLPVHIETTFADSSKTLVEASTIVKYSLEDESAGTAHFCVNSDVTIISTLEKLTQKVCYRINTAGEIQPGGWVAMTIGSVTVEFR